MLGVDINEGFMARLRRHRKGIPDAVRGRWQRDLAQPRNEPRFESIGMNRNLGLILRHRLLGVPDLSALDRGLPQMRAFPRFINSTLHSCRKSATSIFDYG